MFKIKVLSLDINKNLFKFNQSGVIFLIFLYAYSTIYTLMLYDFWSVEKKKTVLIGISNKKSKTAHLIVFFFLVAGVPPVFTFVVKWGLFFKIASMGNLGFIFFISMVLGNMFVLMSIFNLYIVSSILFKTERLTSKKNTNFFKKKKLISTTNAYLLLFSLPLVLILEFPIFYNW